MRIFGAIFAITFLSASALAEPAPSVPQPGSLSVAAVETGVSLDWQALEAPTADLNLLQLEEFEEKTRKLNERIEAQIDQRLQTKLERQLELEL